MIRLLGLRSPRKISHEALTSIWPNLLYFVSLVFPKLYVLQALEKHYRKVIMGFCTLSEFYLN